MLQGHLVDMLNVIQRAERVPVQSSNRRVVHRRIAWALGVLALISTAVYTGEPVPTARVVPVVPATSIGGDRAVARLNDWLFVGDNRDNEAGSGMGAVTVFRRVAGGWSEVQKLLPDSMPLNQQFGHSVAADRDPESGEAWLIVGAPAALNINDPARVYFFTEESGVWGDRQVVETPSDMFSDDWFGWDVDIDVSVPQSQPGVDPIWTAAIGAPRFRLDLAPNTTGALLISSLNSLGLWTPAEPPIAIEQNAGLFSELGWSVAIANDVAIAGAPRFDRDPLDMTVEEIGAVHLFVRGAQLQWAANQANENPDQSAQNGDRYGNSVDVAFQTINAGYEFAVGAPGSGVGNEGTAYIADGSGARFDNVIRVDRATPTMSDEFGFAVAIGEDTANGDNRVFISSPTFDTGARGAVLEYRRPLITEDFELIRQHKLVDTAPGQPGAAASVGRDLQARDGEIALSVRPTFGATNRAVYATEVPLFVGTFEPPP